MDTPVWRSIDVDGETYYWTAYPSKSKQGDGPWQSIEYLTVSRRPWAPGAGASKPAGTLVTEEDAIELVRYFKQNGRNIP
jgi:hypothetical protein